MNTTDTPGSQARAQDLRAANRRTAWVLLSVAAVFFLGIVSKYWLLG